MTSQIFANIYLNELDRFVKHVLKPKAYLRYGDDFILLDTDLEKLKSFRTAVTSFLKDELKLKINPKSDKIIKAKWGLKILGVTIWPRGRVLNKRNKGRIHQRLSLKNVASYRGIVLRYSNMKKMKKLSWIILEKLL